jgi:enoyl-CoA hydratase/carnithine racemase
MIEEVRHDDVLELRLERPPANALSPELIAALTERVRAAPAHGARALVLSGRPGLLSAGLDIPVFLALDRDGARSNWRAFLGLMQALVDAPVPLACAVTGHAPAGGCVLALCAHWRVMAQGPFKIGLNEVAVGVRAPEPVHAVALQAVGPRQAERMCTSAELFDPDTALRIGLVDELAPPAEVVAHAVAWTRGQLALPQGALRSTRAMARAGLAASFAACEGPALETFLDEWFGAETRAALQAVVTRLAAKKR